MFIKSHIENAETSFKGFIYQEKISEIFDSMKDLKNKIEFSEESFKTVMK
jgi:hypothetical protein